MHGRRRWNHQRQGALARVEGLRAARDLRLALLLRGHAAAEPPRRPRLFGRRGDPAALRGARPARKVPLHHPRRARGDGAGQHARSRAPPPRSRPRAGATARASAGNHRVAPARGRAARGRAVGRGHLDHARGAGLHRATADGRLLGAARVLALARRVRQLDRTLQRTRACPPPAASPPPHRAAPAARACAADEGHLAWPGGRFELLGCHERCRCERCLHCAAHSARGLIVRRNSTLPLAPGVGRAAAGCAAAAAAGATAAAAAAAAAESPDDCRALAAAVPSADRRVFWLSAGAGSTAHPGAAGAAGAD
mmetsp:Transcript_21477/g.54487  ORF Transcript_21477/g.54487 Transcript_21477/m.54487 type:complete len:310 (-) Transcript_21477:363-1292(-)